MALHCDVIPAAYEDLHILTQLYQLLLYDLSPNTGADLDASGKYAAPELDALLATPGSQPFLVRIAGNLAGFALVTLPSHGSSALACTTCTTLFIVRKYRLQGYGAAVAAALFDRFLGNWEVAAEATYTPGHTFWRAVVDRYTHGHDTEVWVQRPSFRGHVQSFTVPVAAADTHQPALVTMAQK